MIVRSCHRKLPRNAPTNLLSAWDQLHLPWLCPAFYAYSASPKCRRSSGSIATSHPRASSAPPTAARKLATLPRTPGRGFAQAATGDLQLSYDEYIPFDNQDYFTRSWSSLIQNTKSTLPHFDPATPLIIRDSIRQSSPRFLTTSESGAGGAVEDIQHTLDACLAAGWIKRATAILKRLQQIYKPDAPELIATHNKYIEGVILRLRRKQDQGLLEWIQTWFEVEIRGTGVTPNALTYARMIQATFLDRNPKRVDRTIRRYVALAEEAGMRDEAMATILENLTDQQLGHVTRIAPATFFPAPANDALTPEELPASIQSQAPTSNIPPQPHVRAQLQKGHGLVALQKALSSLSNKPSNQSSIEEVPNSLLNENDEEDLATIERQVRIEEDAAISSLERWRIEHQTTVKRFGVHTGLTKKSFGALMWSWHEALLPLIKEEVKRSKEAEMSKEPSDYHRRAYGPFLQLVSPEKLSALTIISSLQLMTKVGADRGLSMARLVTAIGEAVEEESAAESLKHEYNIDNKRFGSYVGLAKYVRRNKGSEGSVKKTAVDATSSLKEETALKDSDSDSQWSSAIRVKVGAALASLLMRAAKINAYSKTEAVDLEDVHTKPAFSSSMEYHEGKRTGTVRMHPDVVAKLATEPLSSVVAKHLPMLVKPVTWYGYRRGGFLREVVSVVRGGDRNRQLKEYIKAATDRGDMEHAFKALDVLGKTPWRINRDVFNVMLEVWNKGEAIANFPPEKPQLDYPPEPAPTAEIEDRKAYANTVKKLDNIRDGLHSERCFRNFQIEVARAYLNETIYFPHNLDFRGRTYPIPPYLNHMGADHCRGLLSFAKGKALGEKGIIWLKVHLANVFGYDKASLTERRDFATDHMDDVHDSASNPLGGRRWWVKAEDPWQCLATCMELHKAYQMSDPTKYVSYMPVHQDGTCNGLQHYAALGGDAIGAKQVNLEPGDRPADIYSAVAGLVQEDVIKDAAEGDETANLLIGKISRKVVKQTVMTNVYGVTFTGAIRQVVRQLEDLYPDAFSSQTTTSNFLVAAYVARKIFKALSVMFNGAREIQFWLGECASRICDSISPEQIQWIEDRAMGKEEKTPYKQRPTNQAKQAREHKHFKSTVIWTTPLKMPVVQPYRSPSTRGIKTAVQALVYLMEPSNSDPVSKRKQLQAFPPNFIHSLDASHMMLSALQCNKLGLTFAAVHDSFWTHAADVDTMNNVIRDSFIQMHSEDIIGRLAAEFSARYKDSMYLASVKRKSPLGQKIFALRRGSRKNKKSASEVQMEELLLEKRRLALLASEDPVKRAEGEAMITAGKLYAEAGSKELLGTEEVKATMSENLAAGLDEAAHALISPGTEGKDLVDGGIAVDEPEMSVKDDKLLARKLKLAKSWENRKIWLWLPLTFPPVPEKGDFDVSRLKDSKYFFS